MENVIIIGSGPAGYTAGLYASRAGLSPLMITGHKIGGQLTDTNDVENYPGYREPVTGLEMMEDFKHQAIKFGTKVEESHIEYVDLSEYPYVVKDHRGVTYETKSIIISTGAETKWLGIESETRFRGLGVSSCATCDGFFYKDQDVIVVGGGDTACEEALYLSNICKSVNVLVRKNIMKASNIMQERIFDNDKIKVHYNTEIEEILGDDSGVNSVKTKDGNIFNCTGVFVAIGHKPATDLFKGVVDLDDDGYIITKPKSTETNIEGVFACGDVQDKKYKQAITAAGTGCMSALDVERFLQKIDLENNE
jgi:thioredoxin reductase (NADPH)